MRRHIDAVMGREGEEDYLIEAAANTEAFHGRFARARELSARAAASALRGGSAEMAATWMAEAALRELEAGFPARARAAAEAAIATDMGRNASALGAIVLARAGAAEQAERLAADLDREFPQATLIQRYWLPCVRASLALGRGDWKGAVSALEAAAPIELGMPQPFANTPMIPPYLRALACLQGEQWADAAREFAKITTRFHQVRNYVVFPLALRGEAMALAKLGKTDEAAALRKRFDAIFAGADAELSGLAK